MGFLNNLRFRDDLYWTWTSDPVSKVKVTSYKFVLCLSVNMDLKVVGTERSVQTLR